MELWLILLNLQNHVVFRASLCTTSTKDEAATMQQNSKQLKNI